MEINKQIFRAHLHPLIQIFEQNLRSYLVWCFTHRGMGNMQWQWHLIFRCKYVISFSTVQFQNVILWFYCKHFCCKSSVANAVNGGKQYMNYTFQHLLECFRCDLVSHFLGRSAKRMCYVWKPISWSPPCAPKHKFIFMRRVFFVSHANE